MKLLFCSANGLFFSVNDKFCSLTAYVLNDTDSVSVFNVYLC